MGLIDYIEITADEGWEFSTSLTLPQLLLDMGGGAFFWKVDNRFLKRILESKHAAGGI